MVEVRLFSVALVNFKLLVPRITSPEKVVAGSEVGVTVIQVLYPLYKASSMVGDLTLPTLLVLVNFKLSVPRSVEDAHMVISPVKVIALWVA